MDDVVQPYALPRNLHEVVERAAASRHDAVGEHAHVAGPITEAPQEEEEEGHSPPASALADVLDGEEDEDVEMEDVVLAPAAARAPKTMQELAEEAALRDAARSRPAEADAEEFTVSAAPAASDRADRTNGRRGARSSTKESATGPAGDKGKTKGRAGSGAAAGRRSTRKRKRGRAEGSDSDQESRDGDGGGDDGESEGEPAPCPSPAKKARARTRAPPPAVPPSTRVLRARKPKDAAKAAEERAMEDAYRRAVAE